MPIKAQFLAGQTEITVNGLHQWDYGRKLEIRADDLPALIEVHFACAGMPEAVVRSCSGTLGVYKAAIPDRCLEQTSPVVAWICRVDETQTATLKTVILPIIARTKPQASPTVPEIITDKYTELIAAINEQIGNLADGTVKAKYATNADFAQQAESARTADMAGAALTADEAQAASALKLPTGYTTHTYKTALASGLYAMRFEITGQHDDTVAIFHATVGIFAATNDSYVFLGEADNGEKYRAHIKNDVVLVYWSDGSSYQEVSTRQDYWCNIMYKKICSS